MKPVNDAGFGPGWKDHETFITPHRLELTGWTHEEGHVGV